MRVTGFRAVLLSLALLSFPLSAAQHIHLKNGNIIKAELCWKEKDSLKIKITTGIMTIPFSSVEKIVQIEEKEEADKSTEKGEREIQIEIIETPSSDSQEIEISVDKAYQLENELRVNDTPALRALLTYTYNELGIRAMTDGDHSRAESHFRSSLSYSVDEPVISQNLASALIAQEKYLDARDFLFSAELEFPQDSGLKAMLGDVYYHENDLRSALEEWKSAYEITPDKDLAFKIKNLEKELERAGNYRETSSSNFVISYATEGRAEVIDDMLDYLENEFGRLTGKFGFAPRGRISVVIYPAEDFYALTGTPDWVGGIFDGKIKMPTGGLKEITEDAQRLLTHELVHALLHSMSKGRCPRWLHEGLAQYEEGVRYRISPEELLGISASGSPFIWKGKNDYATALSFVDFLIEKYSFNSVLNLIEEITKKNDIDESFRKVYHDNLNGIRRNWIDDLKNRG